MGRRKKHGCRHRDTQRHLLGLPRRPVQEPPLVLRPLRRAVTEARRRAEVDPRKGPLADAAGVWAIGRGMQDTIQGTSAKKKKGGMSWKKR